MWAADEASKRGLPLRLVHIFTVPTVKMPGVIPSSEAIREGFVVDRGLVGSILTRPLHLPEVRSALCEDLELAGFPQALMRFGYPSGAVPASPRRAIDELLGNGF